jgi:hypothetical protein
MNPNDKFLEYLQQIHADYFEKKKRCTGKDTKIA